ncbi:MAG TPA: hypothetical protein VD794_03355 [Flavisolibacter sp.]|nr:hypothetical protein [Flavisolibacter sp.]
MNKKIDYKTTGKTPQPASDKPKAKRSNRLFTSTVEYTMIANLVSQQYQKDNAVRYDALLAIPFEDRIPGLIQKYGNKTMHKLLVMTLREFIASLGFPRYKQPSDTQVSVLACEIMLSSYEDYLGLEDVILFLQRAKAGHYGAIKTLINTTAIMQLLERYRQARHQAYLKLKEQREIELKQLGSVARIAPEPTQLNDLFHQGVVVDMTKRMSG